MPVSECVNGSDDCLWVRACHCLQLKHKLSCKLAYLPQVILQIVLVLKAEPTPKCGHHFVRVHLGPTLYVCMYMLVHTYVQPCSKWLVWYLQM